MAGGSSGGHDAAKSPGVGGFTGLDGVTAPLTGVGTGLSPLEMPAATSSNAGHMTAAQVSSLAAIMNARALEQALIAEALADLGLTETPERLLWFFHPFYARGVFGLNAGISTGTTAMGGALQAVRITTQVSSSRRHNATPDSAAQGWALMFAAGAAKQIWVKGKLRALNQFQDVNDQVGFTLFNVTATRQFTLGINDHANWTADGATGTLMDSGVPVETTAAHILKFWRTASVSRLKVDAAATVTGDVRISSDALVTPIWQQAGAGSGKQVDYHWVAYATETE